jgi:predicted O-methyltransferase YrrM
MSYSDEFAFIKNEEGDPLKAHLIQGQKLPPDGEAKIIDSMKDKKGMLRKDLGFDAVGLSYPKGQDFGAYRQRCGEGIHPSFEDLNLNNEIEFSAGNVHPHTALMLFTLALNQRPKVIIETGTFYGYSTFALAKALEYWDDGGKVYTIDPDLSLVADEVKNHPNVELIEGMSQDKLPGLLEQVGEVQFCFLDSYKRLVYWEFQHCEPYVPEGGIIAFHDTQFLGTGHTLYNIIYSNPQYRDFEKMLFCGKPHKKNKHRFFGNADDRGFFFIRRVEKDPFIEAWDSNSRFMKENERSGIIAKEK